MAARMGKHRVWIQKEGQFRLWMRMMKGERTLFRLRMKLDPRILLIRQPKANHCYPFLEDRKLLAQLALARVEVRDHLVVRRHVLCGATDVTCCHTRRVWGRGERRTSESRILAVVLSYPLKCSYSRMWTAAGLRQCGKRGGRGRGAYRMCPGRPPRLPSSLRA